MSTTSKTGTTTFETPTDLEIRATRTFRAPRDLVFEAWTSPEHLPHWMLGPDGWTMTVCEIDLRPGGAWHFVWSKTDGSEMGMTGVYEEIVRPERVVNSESWGGDWADTLNTLVLTEVDGHTTSVMTTLYPSLEARDLALGSGMKEGMTISFNRLETYLSSLA
jgi:uncharacterized protein YndB with AHSA1/START domain